MTTSTADPGEKALEMLVQLAGELDSTRPQLDGWREFASALSAAGVLDPLDDNDARHVAAAVLFDLHHGEPSTVRARAQWLETGGDDVDVAAMNIHDLPATVTALRGVADVAEAL